MNKFVYTTDASVVKMLSHNRNFTYLMRNNGAEVFAINDNVEFEHSDVLQGINFAHSKDTWISDTLVF